MTQSTNAGEDRDVLEGEILLPDTLLKHVHGSFERQQKRVGKRFWPTVKKALKYIPFMEDVIASYYCAMDSRTPLRVRVALMGALAYFVMPIDAIPDLLVVIGFSDDASVLFAVLALVSGHIKDEHRQKARNTLRDESEQQP